MIFKFAVDKTLMTSKRTMLKGLWKRILFMRVLFSRSYLYKRIRVYCFWKFVHRLMDNPWLYINCFQSPWFQCIIIESGIFPWWVSRRGEEGGLHVSKEGGDEKRKEGLIHLSALCKVWEYLQQPFFGSRCWN